jgi:hypothetical protein
MIQERWIPMGTKDIAPYITDLKEADVLVPRFAGIAAMVGVRQLREFKANNAHLHPAMPVPHSSKTDSGDSDEGIGMSAPEAYVWTIVGVR